MPGARRHRRGSQARWRRLPLRQAGVRHLLLRGGLRRPGDSRGRGVRRDLHRQPGKPFFRQERIGRGGKSIYIWKLRSMVPDAHSNPERYMTPEQLETWRREQKLDDDPRITRVGRFLRRTSLDELPQFINVLTGDLSVIGPRPVTLEETYEFGNGRDEFLSCKPGITGWWQVTERNAATWENGDRQMLELFYVRHASLALDLRIFVKTFRAMRRGQ